MVTLNPYLSFRDEARRALEYYQRVLGGSLDISTFDSLPDMGHDPGEGDLVLHGQLTTDDGLVLMASDTPTGMEHRPPQGISVALSSGDDRADSDRLHAVWKALSDGAEVTVPLAPAPWGGEFGMLVDRFGISWMVSIGG